MKKFIAGSAAILIALILISWGRTGHSTIGLIAEHHLTPKARASIQALLGSQTLADVASWADEVRGGDPAYSNTGGWHFINVPLGLSFDQFQQHVVNSDKMNVYTALQKEEAILSDPNAANDQKVAALKFIVHFVGDIHQPMHVSRAEDKGGNNIQVQYDSQGTNLHSLWDTKLLEHAGMNYQQLAEKFDHTTPEQIKKWQSDPQILWAWESYQISTQLYGEIEQQSRNIDNAYYEAHMPIIENRIEKAGIRLAGLLNALFKDAKPSEYAGPITPALRAPMVQPAITIKAEDAAQHIGQTVTVSAKVYGHRDFGSMVLVNLGAAYPDSPLTVVLRGDAKSLGSQLDDKIITVTGQIADYKGKPEIVVTDPSQIK